MDMTTQARRGRVEHVQTMDCRQERGLFHAHCIHAWDASRDHVCGAGPVPTAEVFLALHRDFFPALMAELECAGFSCVQLDDIGGEVDGCLTYGRRPEVPPEAISGIRAEGLRGRAEGAEDRSRRQDRGRCFLTCAYPSNTLGACNRAGRSVVTAAAPSGIPSPSASASRGCQLAASYGW